MPRTATITRDAIIEAGIELIRESGSEQLNARALAKRLGCSTQPVLYQFATMDELRAAIYAEVDARHSAYLVSGLDTESDLDPLLCLGLNYVRFAHEEPHLFRFLFQNNALGSQDLEALVQSEGIAFLVGQVAEETGLDAAAAASIFLTIFISAHGFASLLANNALTYDETLVIDVLTASFEGAVATVQGGSHETAR